MTWRLGPLVIIILIGLILPWLASPLWIRIATEVLMWAGLAQSWNIIGGYTGYLCFGHGAFFWPRRYVPGIAMIHLEVALWDALIFSGILAAVPGNHHWLPDSALAWGLLRHCHMGFR